MAKSLYDDSWHRPHADHKDSAPTAGIDRGPEGLKVTLNTWGPEDGRGFAAIYNEAQSNWGERPSKVNRDNDLTDDQWKVVEKIMEGAHLQNALELITFGFTVEGCTRACTHELVRTRVGASFAQHGGRDNDWRFRKFTRPETVARAISKENGERCDGASCVDNDRYYQALEAHTESLNLDVFDLSGISIEEMEYRVLAMQKAFYAALVDAGVPWQDARRYIGIGHQTYLHANYNFLALRGVIAHRTEHMAVDWEIDCVSQLMVREVYHHCPRVIARALKSHSDKARVNRFATLYSWPPNRKHPEPDNYDPLIVTTFERSQAPFWILDPICLVDDERPVRWIPTSGEWPKEEYDHRLQLANEFIAANDLDDL